MRAPPRRCGDRLTTEHVAQRPCLCIVIAFRLRRQATSPILSPASPQRARRWRTRRFPSSSGSRRDARREGGVSLREDRYFKDLCGADPTGADLSAASDGWNVAELVADAPHVHDPPGKSGRGELAPDPGRV